MSKFIVNKDYGDPTTIVADSYEHKNGYFHFSDGIGQVAALKDSIVQTIDRED